jgi:hypothetical protein
MTNPVAGVPSSSSDGLVPPWLEAALWGLVGAVAVQRAVNSPGGARVGWWLVAAATGVFAADKVLDVYGLLYQAGRSVAVAVDPEHQLRGPNAAWRNSALAVLFAVGAFALWWLLRRDEGGGRGKRWCYAGIVIVLGLVVARLVPGLQDLLAGILSKPFEAAAWLCCAIGLAIGNRKRTPPPRTVQPDGFL